MPHELSWGTFTFSLVTGADSCRHCHMDNGDHLEQDTLVTLHCISVSDIHCHHGVYVVAIDSFYIQFRCPTR